MDRSSPGADEQQSLGRAIRRARIRRNLSQIELAVLLGMHRTQLGHIEQGRKDVRLSSLLRIAHALEIPASMLVRSAEL